MPPPLFRRPSVGRAAWCALFAVALSAGPASAGVVTAGVVTEEAGGPAGRGGAGLVMSSNPRAFAGLNVNHFLGADRFYRVGYTGTRATTALIEGGNAWAGHQDLGHVRNIARGDHADAPADVARTHATWVASHIGGRGAGAYPLDSPAGDNGSYRWGIAHGTTLYSGNIADGFFSNGSYNISSWEDHAAPYRRAILGGLDGGSGPAAGPTADVVNSSWGFTDPDGNRRNTVGVDAMIHASGVGGPAVVSVVSAGNSGPGPNTVGGLAAGYNSISVGALGGANGYDEAAAFSSRGSNDWRVPTSPDYNGGSVSGTARRAAVDIAAPGQTLVGAYYDNGADPNQPDNFYSFSIAGTSFAGPIVAGGAALAVDAGRDLYAGNYADGVNRAIDGRVVKAVLLNAADKTAGWDNGQAFVAGAVVTEQSLDYAVGAGRLNLSAAFDQYVAVDSGGLAGTADVAGFLGGAVAAVGWDFGTVVQTAADVFSSNTYLITEQLLGGSTFNATLSWFVERAGVGEGFAGAAEDFFANLDLAVFAYDPLTGLALGEAAVSRSVANVVEHLSFLLPGDGFYGVEVRWAGENWDFGDDDRAVDYGLAWSGVSAPAAVPEPASLALFLLTAGAGAFARRRRAAAGPHASTAV